MKRQHEPEHKSQKDIAKFYFTVIEGEANKYQCNLCPNIQRVQECKRGYSNLISHVVTAHPKYLEEMNAHPSCQLITAFMLPPRILNVYGWLDLVINECLPFSIVEKEKFREYCKLLPISRNTLMKYLAQLTLIVEKKIMEILPDKFSLSFDGWTLDGSSTHYIGLFATFVRNNISMLFILSPSRNAFY
jgi:hypothetical protein